MRTTVTIDDALLADAREYSGIEEVSVLVREALTRLVQIEAGRRLARMGGTDPSATAGRRRRPSDDET